MGGRSVADKKMKDDEPTAADIALAKSYEMKEQAPSSEDLKAAENLDSIAESEKIEQGSVSTPATEADSAKNITDANMPWHKDVQKLADARVDDPRVIQVDPKDKRLVLDKFQVRTEPTNPWRLDQLQMSLLEDGQQRPVIAAKRIAEDGSEQLLVVSGHGRILAARKKIKKAKDAEEKPAKLERIYVLPVELTDEQAFYLSLWSNIDNRLPMDALDEDDEAAAIEHLINDFKWTQQQVADALHRNQSWVSRRLKQHNVDDQVEKMVKDNEISESHAEVIRTLPKDMQSDVAEEVFQNELTVAQTQKVVSGIKTVIKTGEDLKVPQDLVLEVAEKVSVQEADSELASKVVEAVQPVAEDLKKLLPNSWDRSDFIDKIFEQKGEAKVANDTIEALKKIQEAPLPAEARKHLTDRVKQETVSLETLPELLGNVAKILGASDDLPRYAKTRLWERVADERYDLPKAEKIAAMIKKFLDQPPLDKAQDSTRSVFAENVIDRAYGETAAQRIADYIKSATEAKKDTWQIESDIRSQDWKKEPKAKQPPKIKKYMAYSATSDGKQVLKVQCRDCNTFIFVDPKANQYWTEPEED